MKWLKHLTNAADDEKCSKLIDEFGLEGYGFWWRTLEIVSACIDEKNVTFVTYSEKKLCNLYMIRVQKLHKLLVALKDCELILLTKNEKQITIDVPNILKYRDEWTKKKSKNSGVTTEQTPEPLRHEQNKKREEKEEEEEKEKIVTAFLNSIALAERLDLRSVESEWRKFKAKYEDDPPKNTKLAFTTWIGNAIKWKHVERISVTPKVPEIPPISESDRQTNSTKLRESIEKLPNANKILPKYQEDRVLEVMNNLT